MNRSSSAFLFLSSLGVVVLPFLAGCGREDTSPPETTSIRPVKLITLDASAKAVRKSFPAVIEARKSVELAFDVPGRVEEMHYMVGETVEKGHLLAKLNEDEFQSRLERAEAALELAQAEFERYAPLAESGAVAGVEVDQKRAALRTATADVEAARNDLAETELRAPFGGIVARSLVDLFATVQAKQPVLILKALEPLNVSVDVPEALVLRAPSRDDEEIKATVSFDSLPGVSLPVALREFSTQADPSSQTYEAIFSLEETGDLMILPGMSATLRIAAPGREEGEQPFYLPPLAVQRNTDGSTVAWVYDPATGEVHPQDVTVGQLLEPGLEILGGLEAGDQVVTSGISELRPGMKVRPYQR